MKEKPILMSIPMVQAVKDGRKTQTRRVFKKQPEPGMKIIGPEWYEPIAIDRHGEEVPGKPIFGVYADMDDWGLKAPYQPGDILWVREETWTYLADGPLPVIPMVGYKADMSTKVIKSIPDGKTVYNAEKPEVWKWRPSIFMPREAARIFLKVTDVRVERVREITEEDVLAEGCGLAPWHTGYDWPKTAGFAQLWDSLNAKRGYSWASNPWVWVYEFERVEAQGC